MTALSFIPERKSPDEKFVRELTNSGSGIEKDSNIQPTIRPTEYRLS